MNSVLDQPTLKVPTNSTPTLAVSRGRGFQASTPDFGQAPQIDGRGFLAAHEGTMAIGQGIQNVGYAVGQMAQHALVATTQTKVAQAKLTTTAAQLDIAKAQAAEPDSNKWEGIAATMADDVTKGLIQKDTPRMAVNAINAHALEWKTHLVGQTKIAAYNKQFSDAGATLGNLYQQQLNDKQWGAADETLKQMDIYLGPDGRNKMRLLGVYAKQGVEQNAVKAHIYGDDLKGAESIIKTSTFMDEDQKKIALFHARKDFNTITTTRDNQASAQFFGDLNRQRANGTVFAPEQVNQWAKDGKLSDMQAAHLIEQYKNETPAPAEQFNDFINSKVIGYDSTKDTTGAEVEQIQREAFAMGIDRFQAGRLNANLETAIKRNQTPKGRVESSLKKWMSDGIMDLMKSGGLGQYKTTGESENILGALGDVTKMQAYGLSSDQAKRLNETPGIERIRLFQEFAKDRVKATSGSTAGSANYTAKKYNTLSDWTKGLLDRASNGEPESLVRGVDAKKEMEAGARAAGLQDKADSWFDDFAHKNNRLPTDKEATQAFHDITGADRRGGAWSPTVVPDQASAGLPSLRGYTAVPDLSERLPENLAPHAADFQEAAQKYNLDPLALAAISMHETGSGTSKAFKAKNNAMGVSNSHGPVSFDKVRDSIFQQAKTLAGPLYQGADTFDQVGKIYAPVGAENDPTALNGYWPGGVGAHYAKLKRKE